MIQVTPHMRIVVAVAPVDFRKGIDSLAAVCRQQLQSDPFSGAVFVFTNKSRQALRLLLYDGQGFWLCHKRLSKGRFVWPFRADAGNMAGLSAGQLQQLLWNANPLKMIPSADFRRIAEKNLKT
jgi:transposase